MANQPEVKECYNLAPIIKHLHNDADVLNAFLRKKMLKLKYRLKGV